MVVPEPGETELIVSATHVEAPPIDVYEDADGQRSFALDEETADEQDGFAPVEPAEFEDYVHLDGPGDGETQEMDAVNYAEDEDEAGGAHAAHSVRSIRAS